MKTKKSTISALRGIVGAVAAVASASAFALPVTEWGYEINSGFTSYTGTAGGATGITGSNINTEINAPSKLSWGTGTPSSFSVGSASNGQIFGSLFTDAAAVNTVQVIHDNNPINGTTLQSAVLTDQIRLWSISPSGPDLIKGLTFNIRFLETQNQTPCVITGSGTSVCNDIFVLDVAGAGFNPIDNSLNQNIMYNGDDYNIILRLAGLAPLSNAACDAVYGDSIHRGCIGFTTNEDRTNTFQVSLQISSTPFNVPEPGSLALLGLGLFGLGALRRRNKA